jgi:flagellar motor switch protein FliM
MPSVSSPSARPSWSDSPRLDSRTLGRPVHLLQKHVAPLQTGFAEWFVQQLNRRYGASYEVTGVSIRPMEGMPSVGRWSVLGEAPARVGCLLDRSLVLSVMALRYGAFDGAQTQRETATEERARAQLGRQFLRHTLTLLSLDGPPLAESQGLQAHPRFDGGSWLIEMTIRESHHSGVSMVWFVLEHAWIDMLLKRLAKERTPVAAGGVLEPVEFARSMALTLRATLLEQTMLLGDLLVLKPGDIIPVRLKGTDVTVDGARLFTASVAEHQGKLCLTSFSDAD